MSSSEFDVLSYVGVHPLGEATPAEAERAEQRRRAEFNELQYRSHVENERRQKETFFDKPRGKCHRFLHHDQRHPSHEWFSDGSAPPTHQVVGRSTGPPADRSVAHMLNSVQMAPRMDPVPHVSQQAYFGRAYSVGNGPTPAGARTPDPRSVESFLHTPHQQGSYNAKRDAPAIVLRARTPPPSMRAVASRHSSRVGTPTLGRAGGRVSLSPPPGTPGPQTVSGVSTPTPAASLTPMFVHSAPPKHPSRSGTVSPRSASTAEPMAMDERYASHFSPHADKDGILRGVGGRDEVEGAARALQRQLEDEQLREEHEALKAKKQRWRAELDAAVKAKRERVAAERRHEDQLTYGFSLPIATVDPRAVAESQRAVQANLQHTWAAQAKEHSAGQARIRHATAPDRSMWWLDADRMESSRVAADAERAAAQDPAHSWKRAWQEHQQAVGDEDKHRRQQAEAVAALTLSPNVANYADRILLAEQQRRSAREQYKSELDQQRRDNRQFRQEEDRRKYRTLIADNFPRENRFSRPPFAQYTA